MRALGIDLGRTRLYLNASPGAKSKPPRHRWGAREGQRATFGDLHEVTQIGSKVKRGSQARPVVRPDAAKMDGRTPRTGERPRSWARSRSPSRLSRAAGGRSRPCSSSLGSVPPRNPNRRWRDAALPAVAGGGLRRFPRVDLDRLDVRFATPARRGRRSMRFYETPEGRDSGRS